MTTYYCPHCYAGDSPIELDEVYSSSKHTVYRCPRCLLHRVETHHMFAPDEVRDVTTEEAHEAMRRGGGLLRTLFGVAVATTIIAAIASSQEDE